MPSHVFLMLLVISLAAGPRVADGAVSEPRRVLLLYSERAELPAIRAVDTGLREAFATRGGVEVFAEYFDFARFPAAKHSNGLVNSLKDKYASIRFDMVITTAHEALKFAVSQRETLFPGVPLMYCGIERRQLEETPLPPGVTGALLTYDFKRTVDLAMKLQPGVRQALCVFGSSEFDRLVGQEALTVLAGYPELTVRRVDTEPYEKIIEQVRRLPADSMVLHVSMLKDSAGQTRLSPQVAGELSEASPVPVYSVASHHLETGVLGGAMMDYVEHGREIGAMAVARLDGRLVAAQEDASSPLLINWRAMKKWSIPASRIPEGAVVRYKDPTLWEEHRGMIIGIFAVVAMQSTLIAGLLISSATRRRAERALAESKERMRLAADAARLGMWVWDVAGKDAWMTERGRAMFGFKPGAPLDYAVILDRVHPEDREARELAIKEAFEKRGEYELEYRLQMPDGDVRWISARGRCAPADNGKDSKMLGVSMDVTARKEAELEAAQQREALSHLSRVALVGEMATSLAHELNQPLTAIVTNANAALRFLTRGDMPPEELQDLLSDISADGHRAGDVIRGIKSMVGKVETERHLIDINQVIDEVQRLVRADALAHDCTLTTQLELGLPPVLGNAVQMQQVLLNLIINAFDAMRKTPCKSCRVDISSVQIDEQMIEVSVKDCGPGLPANAGARVFDRFYSTKSDGMGMGLSIARSIVESHGGTMGAENAEEGGARFWLRVPVHHVYARREAAAP